MKYSVVIPRCGGGVPYEGNPAVGCERADVEFVNGHGDNPGSARNDALERVSGDWIVYCDADDRLLPAVLDILDRMTAAYPEADMIRYGYRTNVGPQANLSLWQYAYRRRTLGGLRFPPLMMGEDLLYLERCLRTAKSVVGTDEIGYEHIVRTDSLSLRRPTKRMVLDTIAYTGEYLRQIGAGEPLLSISRFALSTRLLEHVPDWILSLPAEDRDSCWDRWFAELGDPCLRLTRWAAVRRRCLTLLPSRRIAFLLCVFPHRLKWLMRGN